jgi:hypothetical protein
MRRFRIILWRETSHEFGLLVTFKSAPSFLLWFFVGSV